MEAVRYEMVDVKNTYIYYTGRQTIRVGRWTCRLTDEGRPCAGALKSEWSSLNAAFSGTAGSIALISLANSGVSVPQASKDLTLYENEAPGNLQYDKSAKRYRASNNFKPVFLEPNAAAYLTHLHSAMVPIADHRKLGLRALPTST